MGAYSQIDVALSEMKYGRGEETVSIGSIGVCLDDSGIPVKLYRVDTIYKGCGTIEVFPLDNDDAPPRELHISDFWALV